MSDDNRNNVTALAMRETQAVSGAAQWRNATDIAGAVRELVLKCTITINSKQGPKRYLRVHGFQAIANAFGCVGSCAKVERIEGGWLAHGEVRRQADGVVVATGFGFVGDGEAMWKDREEFAKLAMAQTRAIGRACRGAYAFLIPLIDAGLETTPAEEMESVEGEVVRELAGKSATERLKDKVIAKVGSNVKRPTPQEEPPPVEMSDFGPPQEGPPGDDDDSEFRWKWGEPPPQGKKGQPLSAVTVRDLEYGIKTVSNGLKDPSKARFHDEDRRFLGALQRELARRG